MDGRPIAGGLSRLTAHAKGIAFLPACLVALAGLTGTALLAATTVSVSPASTSVQALGTQSLTATASAASAYSWSVDGIAGGNATVGTIAAQAQGAAASAAGVRGVYTGSGKSLTVPVQAGDLIVVAWEVSNSPATTSCSDSGGNAYKQIGSAVYASGMDASGYFFYGVAQATNPSLQVAIKSLDTSSIAMQVTVLRGMSPDPGSVLDGYASNVDASYVNSHSTGTVKTSAAGDVLVAFWAQDYKRAVLSDNGTGFTLSTQAVDGGSSAYKLAGAAGSYNAAVTSFLLCAAGQHHRGLQGGAGRRQHRQRHLHGPLRGRLPHRHLPGHQRLRHRQRLRFDHGGGHGAPRSRSPGPDACHGLPDPDHGQPHRRRERPPSRPPSPVPPTPPWPGRWTASPAATPPSAAFRARARP